MRHGTTTGYCYYKCRCELCKQAQKNYMNEYRRTSHGKTRQKLSNDISDVRKQLAAEWVRNMYPHIWKVICSKADEHTASQRLKKMEDRRRFNGKKKEQSHA